MYAVARRAALSRRGAGASAEKGDVEKLIVEGSIVRTVVLINSPQKHPTSNDDHPLPRGVVARTSDLPSCHEAAPCHLALDLERPATLQLPRRFFTLRPVFRKV